MGAIVVFHSYIKNINQGAASVRRQCLAFAKPETNCASDQEFISTPILLRRKKNTTISFEVLFYATTFV